MSLPCGTLVLIAENAPVFIPFRVAVIPTAARFAATASGKFGSVLFVS